MKNEGLLSADSHATPQGFPEEDVGAPTARMALHARSVKLFLTKNAVSASWIPG